MRKFLKLVNNENIKAATKVSTIVILIILLCGVFVIGAGFKISEKISNNVDTQNREEYINEECDRIISDNENYLKELENSNNFSQQQKETEIKYAKLQIERAQFCKKNKLEPYNYYGKSGSWKSEIVEIVFNTDYLYNNKENTEQAVPLVTEQEKNLLLAAVDNNNFSDYIDYKLTKVNTEYTDDIERKVATDILNLRKENKITFEDFNSMYYASEQAELCSTLFTIRVSLAKGINTTSDYLPLTPSDTAEFEKMDTLITYKLENSVYESQSSMITYSKTVESIGLTIISLLLILLAGSTVSQEHATGTIKSLIITPYKRWKIYIAKFASCTLIGLAAAILLYIVSVLFGTILFGLETTPYLIVIGDSIFKLNFYVYELARILVGMVEPLIYMTFALMLSTITRNTALSVGIGMFVKLANGIFMQVILAVSMLTTSMPEFVKFVPFTNFDLVTRVFDKTALIENSSMFDFTTTSLLKSLGMEISLPFSAVYLIGLFVLMLYTGFDSFNRRDI